MFKDFDISSFKKMKPPGDNTFDTMQEIKALKKIPIRKTFVKEFDDQITMDQLRDKRNRRLAETDFWGLSDMTMTDAQKKYRQDLRDITKTATSLDDVKWPTKP